MRCRFAFSQTSDGRLLVTMEALWGFPSGANGKFCVSVIDDENTFIQHVVLANLPKEETIELIASVLLVVSGRPASERWIAATVSQLQLTALGMHLEPDEPSDPNSPSRLGFVDEDDLARVFLDAPTPICMMAGPKHVFTYMNTAYLRLLGRRAEDVIGKPVREALSELDGQPFFALLDKVFQTGEAYVGVEVPARLYHDDLRTTREAYFDFIYHPVRDTKEEVCGILCQATDVTERVLEKHVRESREEKLYRQWAEMDGIYQDSPVAMCLIDAKTLRILRLNRVKARMFGDSIVNLIGRKVSELPIPVPGISQMYEQIVRTKVPANFEVEMPTPADANQTHTFLWNLNPVFSQAGEVESIASVVVDLTNRSGPVPAEPDQVQTASL